MVEGASGLVKDPMAAWDEEYNRRGIPSSHRDEPSGVLRWGLMNLELLTNNPVQSAIDIGCGTGRNAIALAEAGVQNISAIDFSDNALSIARARPKAHCVNFVQGDVTKRLPFPDHQFDLATDVFVYFHQLADEDRARYRREIHRVLQPGGLLLLSLATNNDGYYSSCPIGPLKNIAASVQLAWDPVAEVGNILLSHTELFNEFTDLFELEMTWTKRKPGQMHGAAYLRETVATIWRAKTKFKP